MNEKEINELFGIEDNLRCMNEKEINELLGIEDNLNTVEISENDEPICKKCMKKASELSYYIDMAADEKTTAAAVAKSDGTYNWITNKFYCMKCYVSIGCPLGTA